MISCSGNRVDRAKICLNAVYVKPYRAVKAEEEIIGREINEASAEAACSAAISEAKPLKDNAYMVQVARILVKRSILACN
jgi:xanthine dehydrogenase YagS FAD-binding subunit